MAKTRYETHVEPYLDRIKIWTAKGATTEEVAKKLNTTAKSLYAWKRVHSELSEALSLGRGCADDEVEAALYKRCTGYEYEEVTRWQTIGRDGQIMWLEKRTKKHLPPDPSSIQFWLTNRRPKEWKRQPEVKDAEAVGENGVVMMPEVADE